MMLASIGARDVEALFAAIPKALRLSRPLDLPEPLPEWELSRHMQALAAKNATTRTHNSFLGGGAYDHYIPAVVDAIVSRGEFLTSYTPYQPEISQGLLQALFEYQTALSAITGLPVVNGSCYDGATALADAAWCTCLISGTQAEGGIVLSEGVWPHWREVVNSYMGGRGVGIQALPLDKKSGRIDVKALDAALAKHKSAGFLFQTPNSVGVFEDVKAIADICAKHGVTSVCAFNPLAAGIVTPPGLQGVDIVVCDGQPLGIPLSAGGPSLGVFATRREYRKYVPGRLIGKVTDINGNLAYALVYEDREQHVARERATSNICSNQALNALRAVIYLASLGEGGLSKIAALNARKAHYLAEKLSSIGVEQAFDGAFFNEFVVVLSKPVAPILKTLQENKIFGGIDYSGALGLKHALLISVTETKTRADMDAFAHGLKKTLA
ncbi:MAG: aminomethyl-transferring glycine dehydrogenase subunit GcvPA [Pseudomonadota bacterium]|nr:aminomethyl-transferring glycine dehydrogenase subunit GcvPA [Pseudomonadota bacterium]MDE3038544.1 aminomethyl-transferring glycine dehydrogenase subunit GcvPA [Pseudomonadota bacterium]